MQKTTGENIAYYRKLRGMTQKELAEKVGISTSFMSQIENNISNPSWENLEKIAVHLDTQTSALLDGEDDKKDPIYEMIEALKKLTKFDTIEWKESHSYISPVDDSEPYTLLCYSSLIEDTEYKVCRKEKEPDFIELYIKEPHDYEVLLTDSDEYKTLYDLVSIIIYSLHDKTYVYKNLKTLKKLLGED